MCTNNKTIVFQTTILDRKRASERRLFSSAAVTVHCTAYHIHHVWPGVMRTECVPNKARMDHMHLIVA